MFKTITILAAVIFLSACANTSADYYKAIQETSEANSRAYTAKMTALAQLASNGDASAQGAAVMAMALSQPTTIAPQYIESQALSWARVLATPVAAITGLYLQTDLAKHQSDNTARVQLGQQSVQINSDNTNASTILGVSQNLGVMNSNIATITAQSAETIGSLGVAGFNALTQQTQVVSDVATSGLNTANGISTNGLNTANSISTNGLNTIDNITTNSLDAINTSGAQSIELINSNNTGITNVIEQFPTNKVCISDINGAIVCN